MSLIRDRRNSTSTVAQRQQNKGFLEAAYCRGGEYCHNMSHGCPVRSILMFSLFACGVLSAPIEDQSEMRIYTDRKNEVDALNFEAIKDNIYSKKDDISKVFLKFAYEQLERSRQKRMPPESYGPIKTNRSSSEVLDMNTSFVHPTDDDDETEPQTFQSKDLAQLTLNNTCNETNSNNTSLSPTTSERSSCSENVSNTEPKVNLTKEMEKKLELRKRKKSFPSTTDSSQFDKETPSTTIAMTTIKDTSNTQGTNNNHNELRNVSGSTEQLNTESMYISSTTIDSTESSEVIPEIQINSSTTETTQDEDTDTSKKSITKAEIKKENKAKDTGMPSGVIALITAITFSIAIVIAYVGLIVWRRYLDYRYGKRELLVNDLEFDTNDLHHFEL